MSNTHLKRFNVFLAYFYRRMTQESVCAPTVTFKSFLYMTFYDFQAHLSNYPDNMPSPALEWMWLTLLSAPYLHLH